MGGIGPRYQYQIRFDDVNDVLKILNGGYPYPPLEPMNCMQFPAENVPTDTSEVLDWYIYKNPACKPAFQEAVKILLRSGSADDFYLGYLYIYSCLVQEAHNHATFKLDKEAFIPLLREGVRQHETVLSQRDAFVGGGPDCMQMMQKGFDHLKNNLNLPLL